jgi:hypothetical protein
MVDLIFDALDDFFEIIAMFFDCIGEWVWDCMDCPE